MNEQRTHPPRGPRAEPRDIGELKQLRMAHPELASAVDLQMALVELQHRVQSRVPMPWIEADPSWLRNQQEQGRPLLGFRDIPLDWTDVRLMFRQTADILRRFEAIEEPDYAALQHLARDGHALEPVVVAWYEEKTKASTTPTAHVPAGLSREALDQVLALTMRPFLERCAEVVQQRTDFSSWLHPYCPLCGGEPEFALITQAADRLLICSRCAGRWRYDPLACPFCRNDDRSLITSFASRDGQYRLYACDVCRRYLKAYDGRRASRPLMLAVDSIATLPLDAAAMQRGYQA